MICVRSSVVVCTLAFALSGCASDDADDSKATVQPFDPAGTHFGKTYGEWGAEWWAWVLGVPGCSGPLADPTGVNCLAFQNPDVATDPNRPVFFLAGTEGGIAVREQCPVPADKPLFFPILNMYVDDVGSGVTTTPEEKCASIEAAREAIDPADLFVEVDGAKLAGLDSYWGGTTLFSYDVPPEPNKYSCGGIPGIVGTIAEACSGGYHMLLPPLGAGSHEIRFGGRVEAAQFELDVTYRWTAQ